MSDGLRDAVASTTRSCLALEDLREGDVVCLELRGSVRRCRLTSG